MQRAGIYVRVSIDRDGRSESPERQEADCRALCAQRSIEVEEVYADRDVSGFKNVKRPEYQRMLSDLRSGRIDTIVVWKIDRLTRQGLSGISRVLDELSRVNGHLLSYNESINSSDPMSQAMLGVLASVAQQESLNTSLRTKRAHSAAAARGQMHSGGTRKFGYERDTSVNQEEAKIIREVYERALDGQSMFSIARDLNTRGVRSPTGKEWRANSLANALRSPRVSGRRFYNGVFYDGTWEPILTPDEHALVLAALTRGKPAPRERRHLLTGMIRCANCGCNLKNLRFRMKNGKLFDRYQCVRQPGMANCGSVAVTKISVEEYAAEAFMNFVSRTGRLSPDGGLRRDEETLSRQQADDEQALAELAKDRYFNRAIGDVEFRAAREPLDARLSNTKVLLESIRRRRAESKLRVDPRSIEDLAGWWDTASIPERRLALRAFFVALVVHPAKRRGGNRFDRTRIEFLLDDEWWAPTIALARHPMHVVDPLEGIYVKPASKFDDPSWMATGDYERDHSYFFNEKHPPGWPRRTPEDEAADERMLVDLLAAPRPAANNDDADE